MKRLLFFLIIGSISGANIYAQNYSDLFTTYKSVPSQPKNPHRAQNQNNSYVPQYEVMDANQFNQSISPQNVQTVSGYFIHNGQLYSIKLQVGISGTNHNQLVVCAYWDGQMWNKSTSYPSPIGYSAPEQIKRACTHEVYISSVGKVYF